LDHCRQHLGIVGFAVLVVVEVLRQDDRRVTQFGRRGSSSSEKVYAEYIQIIGKLLPEHSHFTTGNMADFKSRRSGHDPGNPKA
jgi:hypothetical protein